VIQSQKTIDATARVRYLNDLLRKTGIGGQIVMAPGIASLEATSTAEIAAAVAAFDAFDADNDPYGEHDCACLQVGENRVIWKIDYYDLSLRAHSPDKSDAAVTRRVLTIVLATEY